MIGSWRSSTREASRSKTSAITVAGRRCPRADCSGLVLAVCAPPCLAESEKAGCTTLNSVLHCDLELSSDNVSLSNLIASAHTLGGVESAPYIDGDDITRRYIRVKPSKRMRLDLEDWEYKSAEFFEEAKILIRQAGVGVSATLDESGARYPQSVYYYRVKSEYQDAGYSHEFLLAVLASRTFAYYVFKRFGEVDPARAHVKLTHARLASMPVPKLDFSSAEQRHRHRRIVASVHRLLDGSADLGGSEGHRTGHSRVVGPHARTGCVHKRGVRPRAAESGCPGAVSCRDPRRKRGLDRRLGD